MILMGAKIRAAREHQRKQFIEVIALVLVDLDEQEIGKAMEYLDGKVGLIRDKIKKFKTLFGPDLWKIASSEKILAFLSQQVLKSEEKSFQKYHPEILDWLYGKRYDAEGESTLELSHINVRTEDIPEEEDDPSVS